ncbi:MAG: PorV/PorQ family protein [Bacteroidetes bacterium]|nr:PorV/PorQ family protein [Bacteroidota bacterium]
MKSFLLRLTLILALALPASHVEAQLLPNLGGQRVGISAFQFLKLGVGARGVGMGESFVAVANDVSALYWNPAGLVQFSENQAMAAHTEYVVGISHEFFGVVYHLGESDALGASFMALHMDEMEITTETQPFGTGRYFRFGDVALSVSYSRKMTDRFSFGLTVRYAEETLDVLSMRSFMIDVGTFYWTGLGSSRFAVVIANFGGDVTPQGSVTGFTGNVINTFQSFSLPTMFKLGFAIDPIMTERHLLTASIQLSHLNDNSENLRLGLEYGWNEVFYLRAGIKRTIDQSLLGADATTAESYSFGAGVQVPLGISTVGADYSYSDFSRLGKVHRLDLAFTF